MRKTALLCALLFASFFSSAPLKAQDKIEIFGGFSYARVPVQVFSPIAIGAPVIVIPPGTCPIFGCPPGTGGFSTNHVNTHGWEFSGAFKPTDWLGAVADFSGHYGSTHGSNLHLDTYLFGPQVSFPARVSPFVHVLFGAAHESISNPSVAVGVNLGANTGFATAIGAGFDIKLFPSVFVRIIQIDYLMTHLGGRTQNQPRASAGLVLHF